MLALLYEQSPLGLSAASIVVDSLFLVHEQLALICNTRAISACSYLHKFGKEFRQSHLLKAVIITDVMHTIFNKVETV